MKPADMDQAQIKTVTSPSEPSTEKSITLEARIKASPIYWLSAAILFGFLSGLSVYQGILGIAQLEVVSKPQNAQISNEISHLRLENEKLAQENEKLKLEAPSVPSVTVTYPQHGQEVGEQEMATGTWRNIPEEWEIWIVSYSRSEERFYPGSTKAVVYFGGNWDSNINIGGAGDMGHDFDLLAVTADKAAQKEFQRYADTPDSSGLQHLPNGTRIFQRIAIRRTDVER